MTNRTFRELSRLDFTLPAESSGTESQVKIGALQRIADATELMAKNHASLVADRDFWKSQAKYAELMRSRSDHRVRALKGVITKLRRSAAVAIESQREASDAPADRQ